jgi:hypothetical protein
MNKCRIYIFVVYSFQVKGKSDKFQNKSICCLLLSKIKEKPFQRLTIVLKLKTSRREFKLPVAKAKVVNTKEPPKVQKRF